MKSTIPMSVCNSSKIAYHGYDADRQILALQFQQKGGLSAVYEYPCTPEMWERYQAAESKGKFFNEFILKNPDMPATKMVDEPGQVSDNAGISGSNSETAGESREAVEQTAGQEQQQETAAA